MHVVFLLKIKGRHFPEVGLHSSCCIKSYRLNGIKIGKSEINASKQLPSWRLFSICTRQPPSSVCSHDLLCIQDWKVSPFLWEDLKCYRAITLPSELVTQMSSAKPATRSGGHWCLGLPHMNLGKGDSEVQGHPSLYTSARFCCGENCITPITGEEKQFPTSMIRVLMTVTHILWWTWPWNDFYHCSYFV